MMCEKTSSDSYYLLGPGKIIMFRQQKEKDAKLLLITFAYHSTCYLFYCDGFRKLPELTSISLAMAAWIKSELAYRLIPLIILHML
jgi:hypothetical protein